MQNRLVLVYRAFPMRGEITKVVIRLSKLYFCGTRQKDGGSKRPIKEH